MPGFSVGSVPGRTFSIPLALGGGTASLAGAVVAFLLGRLVDPLWTLLPAVA